MKVMNDLPFSHDADFNFMRLIKEAVPFAYCKNIREKKYNYFKNMLKVSQLPTSIKQLSNVPFTIDE